IFTSTATATRSSAASTPIREGSITRSGTTRSTDRSSSSTCEACPMLRRVLSALGRSLAVRASAREWHALAAGPEPRVAAVARALLRATRAPANGDERNALDGVQALRTRMLKSDDRLEVVDHGAGSPDAWRTPEE